MKTLYKNNLYLVLIHHPVLDKYGNIITSSVTNLDLHDIARLAKTYGIKKFYIVTPLKDQKILVSRILDYWLKGNGAKYNPIRSQALKLVRLKSSYEDVYKEILLFENYIPKIIVTTARKNFFFSYKIIKKKIYFSFEPYVILFGTAWGLSNSFLYNADYILEPIRTKTNYNHLSVRSAVSIILDRLFR